MKPEDDIGVRVTGWNGRLEPLKSFEELPFHKGFKHLMDREGWRTPTRIQAYAIPIVLKNKGLIGVSATGSGKTLAYVLPMSYIMSKIPNSKTLVLAPTRQLCRQIATEFSKLMPKDVGCIYGGVHKSLQMNDLFRKVVVATPGRLIDFLRRHALHFDFVVIDEADRILEGNFMEQLDEIIQGIGKYEQMLMFTATVTREVDELIRKYIKDPVKLTIGGSNSFNANIKQEIVMSRSISSKRDEMLSILREYRGYKVLIFTNTKSKTQELCQQIRSQLRQRCSFINGDVPQDRRETYIQQFREGNVNVMVATDVASRGLDIKDIRLVLNFDFPKDIQTYTHRIGRTARYNKTGNAISFLQRQPSQLLCELVEFMVKCKQNVPLFLVETSGYPPRRIKELEEYLKSQELPSDMPPSPPPPQRVKEQEYFEGSSIVEQREPERQRRYEEERRPLQTPFSKMKSSMPEPIPRSSNRGEEFPRSNSRGQNMPVRGDNAAMRNNNPGNDLQFGRNSCEDDVLKELNEDLNASFQHYNIPADLQQSFLNLSFRKIDEQSFIESSRVHTDKSSILSHSKKNERFDLNKYKPQNVTTKLKFDGQSLAIVYGKFNEYEDEALVVGRHSASYLKIRELMKNCEGATIQAETKRVLEEMDVTINKVGVDTQNLAVLGSHYHSVMLVNHLKIKKDMIWIPIFQQIAKKELETVTVALPIHGNNGQTPPETDEEIEFLLTNCIMYLTEQQELKSMSLMIENQTRYKRFLDKVARMGLL